MNIENQKDQIARILEGVRVDGRDTTIRFNEESEHDRIDATLEVLDHSIVPISFVIQEQTTEEAVIADILSQFIAPDELPHDISSTVLEITEKTDSLICAFAKHYADHEITSSSYYDNPQISIVKLSTRAMDRLACAWIKWRVKSNLGEIEDHPF